MVTVKDPEVEFKQSYRIKYVLREKEGEEGAREVLEEIDLMDISMPKDKDRVRKRQRWREKQKVVKLYITFISYSVISELYGGALIEMLMLACK